MAKRGLDDGKSDPSASTSLEDDAALAELLSLLDPAPFSVDACITALQRAQGDVSAAAEILLIGGGGESSSSSQSPSQPSSQLGPRKRAKQGPLRQWLKPTPTLSTPHLDPSSGSESQTHPPSVATPPLIIAPSPPPTPSAVDRQASAANWAALLSRPPAEKPKAAPQRPIRLATPAAVAASGLPLAILTSPLTPSFAAQLFHEMMAESSGWGRNKLYIAGKEVQSNHQATSYARQGEEWGKDGPSAYYYNGVKYGAKPFTPCLSKAADMVEAAVNEYLDSVPRYPLEYKGRWRANACAANRYDGAQATVGFHSDQMTYLGPYPTIASLSLGTPRAFRLRAVATADPAYAPEEPPRTYEVTLGHNSLVLMTPGCQERYKHTIPPQRALDTFRMGWDAAGDPIPPDEQTPFTSRINITFRFYRDDFRPDPRGQYLGTPICKCGIPAILRADQRAKARAALGVSRGSGAVSDGVVDDEMLHFWQCQSPSRTGEMRGCGFFKILDMRGEGRGPCWGEGMTASVDNEDESAVNAAEEGVAVVDAVMSNGA